MAPSLFKIQPLTTSALDLTPLPILFSRPQEQERSIFANVQARPSTLSTLSPALFACTLQALPLLGSFPPLTEL